MSNSHVSKANVETLDAFRFFGDASGTSGNAPIALLNARYHQRWGTVADEAAMVALTSALNGDTCYRTDTSSTWVLSGDDPTASADWVNEAAGGGNEFADNVFRLLDDGDATKEVAFQLSGITTGTTRTLTVPDADGTLLIGADNLASLTSASTARTNLGLGTLATQAASAVAITGGTVVVPTLGASSRLTVPPANVTPLANDFDIGLHNTSGFQWRVGSTTFTAASLTSTQTLTNKTLTSPTINTPTLIDGTVDNCVIGGSTAADGTFTSLAGQTFALSGQSLTGSEATSAISVAATWNTTGNPALIYGRATNTASGSSAKLLDLGTVAGGSLFSVTKTGKLKVTNVVDSDAYLDLQVGGVNRFGLGGSTNVSYQPLQMNGFYLEYTEQTAPSAPATNHVRVYAEDNGAGKTRLMARFATGAAQQIAIEP